MTQLLLDAHRLKMAVASYDTNCTKSKQLQVPGRPITMYPILHNMQAARRIHFYPGPPLLSTGFFLSCRPPRSGGSAARKRWIRGSLAHSALYDQAGPGIHIFLPASACGE